MCGSVGDNIVEYDFIDDIEPMLCEILGIPLYEFRHHYVSSDYPIRDIDLFLLFLNCYDAKDLIGTHTFVLDIEIASKRILDYFGDTFIFMVLAAITLHDRLGDEIKIHCSDKVLFRESLGW